MGYLTHFQHFLCTELLDNKRKNNEHIKEHDGNYPADYEPKYPELPTRQDLLSLRYNEDVFEIFCDEFLRCVVGKLSWRDRVCSDYVSDFSTPSDEALALLILENSWDRWEQIYDMDGDYRKATISTRWTSDSHQASPYAGWNLEGRERFNELHQIVIRDRNTDYALPVEEKYRQKKLEGSNRKKRKKGSLEEDADFVECADDF